MNIPIVEPIEIGANPMLMVPSQGPGGPIRAPSGVPVVAKRNWKDPAFLTGAIQRPYSFRVKPCLDTHFNIPASWMPGYKPHYRVTKGGTRDPYHIDPDNATNGQTDKRTNGQTGSREEL